MCRDSQGLICARVSLPSGVRAYCWGSQESAAGSACRSCCRATLRTNLQRKQTFEKGLTLAKVTECGYQPGNYKAKTQKVKLSCVGHPNCGCSCLPSFRQFRVEQAHCTCCSVLSSCWFLGRIGQVSIECRNSSPWHDIPIPTGCQEE